MSTVKPKCPDCGEVECNEHDITLMVCVQSPISYYAFTCPSCGKYVSKPAEEHIISLLMSAGVRAQALEIPLEALELHPEDAISEDELINFGLALSQGDFLAVRAATDAYDHKIRA